jgi:hypothetical protein
MLLFFRILSAISYTYFCLSLHALQSYGIAFLGGRDVHWHSFFADNLDRRISGAIVGFIVFFFSERYIRKNLVDDTVETFAKTINTAILAGMVILASILVLIGLMQVINGLVDCAGIYSIIHRTSHAEMSCLFLAYSFVIMKARNNLALASRYILRLQQFIAVYVVISAAIVLSISHPFLTQQMNHDIELREHVNEISKALLAKHIVYDDAQKIIDDVAFAQHERSLKSGEIQYKKKSEEEFELSWEFKTDQREVIECKGSKNIAKRSEMFLDKGYSRGWNMKTFRVQKKGKK